MRILIVFCLLLLGAVPGQAATIGPGSGECTWFLSGVIESGDAERLAALVPEIGEDYDDRQTLCLDSPGGTLVEAVALGRVLVERAVATRLQPDARCLSACAVLFMLGTTYDRFTPGHSHEALPLDGRYPARTIHVSSLLGFHRPSLSLPEGGSYSPEAITRSFDVATDAALELTVLSVDGRIEADLMQEMFSHRGEDYFYIDTIGKALRWNIGVIDAPRPATLDRRAAWNMCNNLVYLRERYEPEGRPFKPDNVEIISRKGDGGGPFFVVEGADSGQFTHTCYIMQADVQFGPGRFWVCGWYGPGVRKIGETQCQQLRARREFAERLLEVNYSTINGFDPGTPLTALRQAARAIEARAAEDLSAPREFGVDAFRRRCNKVHGVAFVTGVQNFTNMRARPDVRSAVVKQVPLGTPLQEPNISNPTLPASMVKVDPQAPPHCQELCVYDAGPVSRDANRAARDQCFDSGAYWYELKMPYGAETGYVNGKFLRY